MRLAAQFQSLGRDSVCSSGRWKTTDDVVKEVSISWARFCLFKLELLGATRTRHMTVSISWARFCLFKPSPLPRCDLICRCFNLLGEILSVQAFTVISVSPLMISFQSLGRDSVCSSLEPGARVYVEFDVSISWARFCLFKQARAARAPTPRRSFNLLGEILSVQARLAAEGGQR